MLIVEGEQEARNSLTTAKIYTVGTLGAGELPVLMMVRCGARTPGTVATLWTPMFSIDLVHDCTKVVPPWKHRDSIA